MAGVSGVLPTPYTDLILDRIRHRDTAMWSFLEFSRTGRSRCSIGAGKVPISYGYERGSDDLTDICTTSAASAPTAFAAG